jgi:hypothetical protein
MVSVGFRITRGLAFFRSSQISHKGELNLAASRDGFQREPPTLDNLSGSSTWPPASVGAFVLAERHRNNSFARAATGPSDSFNTRRRCDPRNSFASSAFRFSIGSRRKSRPSNSSSHAQCPYSRAQDVAGSTQRPQVRSRRTRSRFLFILFHLFRLLMQLRRPHTHQQRELGPRLKSAF